MALLCCFSQTEDVIIPSEVLPEPSPDLVFWITGSAQDALVSTQNQIVLVGGGEEPYSGFL